MKTQLLKSILEDCSKGPWDYMPFGDGDEDWHSFAGSNPDRPDYDFRVTAGEGMKEAEHLANLHLIELAPTMAEEIIKLRAIIQAAEEQSRKRLPVKKATWLKMCDALKTN